MSPQDPLLAIAEELRELGGQLFATAHRLSQHAAEAAAPQVEPALVAVVPVEIAPVEVVPVDLAVPVAVEVELVDERAEPPAVALDRFGGRSVAWIGATVTLVGVVLLLVLAIQRGWLGPLPRLLVGAGLSVVLLGLAWRVRPRPGGQLGSLALAGTGIAGLYLDLVAATALYHYLPDWLGLALGLLVAAGGLWLTDRWHSSALAVFVVLAAAGFAPFCAGGPLLIGFLLILAGAASPVQLRRGWPGLAAAAGLPPVLAAVTEVQLTQARSGNFTVTMVAGVLTTVVCLALATITLLRRPADQAALSVLAIAPTPALAVAPLLSRPAGTTLLAVLTVLLLAGWVAGVRWPHRFPARFAVVAGIAGAAVLAEATTLATTGSGLAVMLLADALLFGLVAVFLRNWHPLVVAAVYAAAGAITALVGPLPVTRLVLAPEYPPASAELVTGLVTGLLLTLTGAVITVALLRHGWPTRPLGWITLGGYGVYGSSGVLLCASLLAAPDHNGFLTGHVLVTVCWAVAALVLLALGLSRLPVRIAGLVLVGAAVAKLVLFDLAELDGVARVAAFLGAGIVLLAAGVRYARLLAARHID